MPRWRTRANTSGRGRGLAHARSVSFYRRAGFGPEAAPLGMDLAGD
jgi:hypothetical protein